MMTADAELLAIAGELIEIDTRHFAWTSRYFNADVRVPDVLEEAMSAELPRASALRKQLGGLSAATVEGLAAKARAVVAQYAGIEPPPGSDEYLPYSLAVDVVRLLGAG